LAQEDADLTRVQRLELEVPRDCVRPLRFIERPSVNRWDAVEVQTGSPRLLSKVFEPLGAAVEIDEIGLHPQQPALGASLRAPEGMRFPVRPQPKTADEEPKSWTRLASS
jgi:hypothetical protein